MGDRKILHEVVDKDEKVVGYTLWCPGCKEVHCVYTNYAGHPQWTFDGNLDHPTFSPSLLVYEVPGYSPRCHSFIKAGVMEFLADSTHPLANQKVPLQPWSWDALDEARGETLS